MQPKYINKLESLAVRNEKHLFHALLLTLVFGLFSAFLSLFSDTQLYVKFTKILVQSIFWWGAAAFVFLNTFSEKYKTPIERAKKTEGLSLVPFGIFTHFISIVGNFWAKHLVLLFIAYIVFVVPLQIAYQLFSK